MAEEWGSLHAISAQETNGLKMNQNESMVQESLIQ